MLKTYVAPLLAEDLTSVSDDSGQAIYWMDHLLRGGLRRPENLKGPVVVLLCGPPGAGKSLLAQQLCYSRAFQYVVKRDKEAWGGNFIISAETPAPVVAENMEHLGFKRIIDERKIYSARRYTVARDWEIQLELPDPVPPLLILSPRITRDIWTRPGFLHQVLGCWNKVKECTPRVLVVDSLNILAVGMQRKSYHSKTDKEGTRKATEEAEEVEWNGLVEVYNILMRRLGGTTSLEYLFLIVDSPGVGSSDPAIAHQYWEYVADVIIRVDYDHGLQGYLNRHLEIVKTRFQAHVLGRQVMKIFPKPKRGGNTKGEATPAEGARPALKEGGLFIFPSQHFLLSKIRDEERIVALPTESPTAQPTWPLEYCDQLVGGSDVPLHRTTAIVGRRGLHKSHFAYQFLLDGIADRENTLTISFRDNPEAVTATLVQIANAEKYDAKGLNENTIKGRNKVVYQRPGFVTPEEFLHRVIAAVAEYKPSRVMVGAIDQWDASYPLLAESPILVPTLIDFLNAHNTTSMVIGVEGGAKPVEWCGLTANSDVVLSFDYQVLDWIKQDAHKQSTQEIPTRESRGSATDGFKPKTRLIVLTEPSRFSSQPKVVVQALRVPHGRAGLARAVVEYTYRKEDAARIPTGLRLLPLAPEYPIGIPI